MIDNPYHYSPMRYDDYTTQLRYAYIAAYNHTRNAEDAEDIAQDVALRLWQARDRIDNFSGYARVAVRNACIDYYRQRQTTDELSECSATGGDPFGAVVAAEQIEIARRLVTDEQWQLLLLVANGYTMAEISGIVGKSELAVKALIFRGRNKIREWAKAMV